MRVSGKFHVLVYRRGFLIWDRRLPNGVTDEGLNHIMGTQFLSGTQVGPWKIGLINVGAVLSPSDTMASHSGWTEVTDYDEAARPNFVASAGAVGEVYNPAYTVFTMNATATLYGLFLTSDDTKGGTAGILWSTAKFGGVSKQVQSGDVVRIGYTITATR